MTPSSTDPSRESWGGCDPHGTDQKQVQQRWIQANEMDRVDIGFCTCCRGPAVITEWREVMLAYLSKDDGDYRTDLIKLADPLCSRCS